MTDESDRVDDTGKLDTDSPVEVQDDLWFFRIGFRLAQLFVVLLLFCCVVASPVFESKLGGLLGSSAVGPICLVLVVVTAIFCWIRSARSAGGTIVGGQVWVELVFVCMFAFAVYSFVSGMREPESWGLVTGHDQPQYYAYLHSWVFDRDLDFRNEYDMIPRVSNLMAASHGGEVDYNVAPVGTALLWLPFYLATHVVVLIFNANGAGLIADGMSSPYATGVAFGGIFLALYGIVAIYRVLIRWFSVRTALLTCLLIWYGTPLQWYLLDEAWMSHGCSFFAASLVLFFAVRTLESHRLRDYCILGAAIGVAALVRPSHLVLTIIPILFLVATFRKEHDAKSLGLPLVMTLGCIIVTFLPQLITWYLRTGLEGPPGSPMQWSSPALFSVLFSSHHGLIAWHPVTLAGFVGVPLIRKRSRTIMIMLVLVLGLHWYINAAIGSWWGGVSFGMRRFAGTLPFFSIGIAAFGSWSIRRVQKYPLVPTVILVGGIVLYNSELTRQYRQHWVHPGKPVYFVEVWDRISSHLHRNIGNPFSFPASVQFARQHETSVGQYDLFGGDLAGMDSFDVEGGNISKYLGAGWVRNTRYSYIRGGHANSRDCTIILPLRDAQDYEPEIKMQMPREIDGEQNIRVHLNGDQLGEASIAPNGEETITMRIGRESINEGINHLELTFSQTATLSFPYPMTRWGTRLKVDTARPILVAGYLRGIKLWPLD